MLNDFFEKYVYTSFAAFYTENAKKPVKRKIAFFQF